MELNIFDKVTLSNDEKYIVISKICHEGKTYYYLINENNKEDIKICYGDLENQSMIEIKNREIIEVLFPIFLKKSQENIAEMLVNGEDTKE